jgi:hypothetical protein
MTPIKKLTFRIAGAVDFLRAKILGPVPGHEGSAAQSTKGLAQGRLGEQLLHARETGLQ